MSRLIMFVRQRINLCHMLLDCTLNICFQKENMKRQRNTLAKLKELLKKYFSNFCMKTQMTQEMGSKFI